jgi:Raf kinase inhibitor-like YbhB/YbcL family protein
MRRTGPMLMRPILGTALMAVAGLIGCRSALEDGATETQRHPRIELSSTAFAEGQPIPRKHTGEGADVSPPLAWSKPPKGTQKLALICDDPDAPRGTWVHWVIYNIPATARGLPEGLGSSERPASEFAGVVEGKNSFGKTGYGGPMPPPGAGKHRYFFKLYALDTQLALEPGLDKESLLKAIKGHILGEGELMGTYER